MNAIFKMYFPIENADMAISEMIGEAKERAVADAWQRGFSPMFLQTKAVINHVRRRVEVTVPCRHGIPAIYGRPLNEGIYTL